MVSLVDGLTRCAVRAWGQDRDSNASVWLPRRTEAQAGHGGEFAELLIERLKQGSIFHCSLHFWRHTESIFVSPVGKGLPFYHGSVHLPFFLVTRILTTHCRTNAMDTRVIKQ